MVTGEAFGGGSVQEPEHESAVSNLVESPGFRFSTLKE